MKTFPFFLFIFAFLLNTSLESQTPAQWYSKGIGGGGALFSPSINPSNHSEIYMGCDMSELFHSTDMGASWKEVSFLQICGGHDALMQYTIDPDLRYCVNYPSVSGIDYVLPVKSTDGGTSWSVMSNNPYASGPGGGILRLLVDYNDPSHILMADYGTIYFSSDGGASFHLVHTCLDNGSGNHIAGIFFDSQNIYVGTNDGLLVSTNGGQTFSTMTVSGIPSTEHMLSFAGAKQGGSLKFYCLTATNVWAGYQYGSDYWNAMKGVYYMDNASGSWVPFMNGISPGSDFPVFVGMSSGNTGVVYLTGGSSAGNPIVMKSTGGGAWTHVFLTTNNQNIYTGWAGYGGDHGWSFPEAPFGFTVVADDPNTLMFSDYSCTHITIDGGITWRQQYLSPADENPMNYPTPKGKSYHGIGLENTSCWHILWTDSLNLFAGFADINAIHSSDKGESWKFVSGLTQNSVYRFAKDAAGKIYAATSNVHDIYQSTRIYDAQIDAGTGGVFYSTDGGNSFSMMHNFGHPVVWITLDPTNPERMYASVLHHNKQDIGGIWVTNNLSAGTASSWTKLPAPPRSNGHPYNINVLNNGDLVASFSARKPGYSSAFTDSSGVYYYNLAGSTWYDRSDQNMRFWTHDVVVDPNDASQSTWYVCVFEGWGTSGIQGTGGLFRTTDKGLSWFRINNDYRVNSCTVPAGSANIMYFTTETDGLWYSNNVNSTSPQFTLVANYPFRHPMRVFFNPFKPSEIWVTGFGGGMKKGGDSSTGISIISGNPDHISVWPNPCRDILYISINSGTISGGNKSNSRGQSSARYQYSLTSLDGKTMMQGLLSSGEQKGYDTSPIPAGNRNIPGASTFSSGDMNIIETSSLPSGVYVLKVYGDIGFTGTQKIVKL